MRILVVADPIQVLSPKGDSSLAFVRQLLGKSAEVYWATPEDLDWVGSVIYVDALQVLQCNQDELPKTGHSHRELLTHFSAVLIRKDPPFDSDYVRLCWLLSLFEKEVPMFNRPSLLLQYHEKLVPWFAYRSGELTESDLIPTYLGRIEGAKKFLKDKTPSKIVLKPFLGFGGHGLQCLNAKDIPNNLKDTILQPFIDGIETIGDRRVLYLEGKILDSFVRLPKSGDFVSNLAQGGKAVLVPMTDRIQGVAHRLGKFLARAGIFFAGADLIGDKVSEVNITSPTGLRAIEALVGRDYSELIMETLLNKLKK